MFKIDTSKRTDQQEIMDDFELQGEELRKTLKDLDRINSWLGGDRVTIDGIKKLVRSKKEIEKIRVIDIGCGDGAVLRKVADWANTQAFKLDLLGIDANPFALEIARDLSRDYPSIDFQHLDIFDKEAKELDCDILLCTLTMHHFKDGEITMLMKKFEKHSRLGVVINDLHRSRLAYVLFQAFCAVFVNNEIARKDGLISILRGFKKEDFQKYRTGMNGSKHSIKWKWAFRYQWVIQKYTV
ncbi:class I SAM-dependent methyltransferase [Pontixanthobacter gangjinensis]|uniref:Methyltransferase domain-containing protein n=1 Tax=Christiangramia aestuarii TaxID=1028746 RepID=A0A7K1LPT4_9FLAO|nr:methyltransferase domain-containing protein [Christiangramia aestuarii]MUP42815.1 methyltransferase domain-containing protein [Christiangramia aestuarii]